MAKHYRLSVHDLNGNKLCELYDSRVEQIGAARFIKITKEIEGWKEIEFTLSKRDAEGNKNYRFDFMKNENLLYLHEDGELDVYCIKAPEGTHNTGKVQVNVTCNHISEELKAKNLFKYFDDENGIGTCEDLIQKAIAGTGWILVVCDKFFESDGETEKIRSYKCDTKTGAWNMIAEICKLFKAHPIFHGADRTIEIRSNDDSTGWKEILFGKNSDKLTRTLDSSNMISRLYVEGEYGDHGYVGIDDVNPTGLPFILNFDYYKELGVFTDKHQDAVDKYISDYKENSTLISTSTKQVLDATSELSKLIGTCDYAYYPVIDGNVDKDNAIYSDSSKIKDHKLAIGDRVVFVTRDGSYEYVEYATSLPLSNVVCVIKFIPVITGTMAAHEDLISSSTDSIERYLKELNDFLNKEEGNEVAVSDLHSIYGVDDLSFVKNEDFDASGLSEQYALNTTLEYVYSIGLSENVVRSSSASLKKEMLRTIELIRQIDDDSNAIKTEIERQGKIENEFCVAMGVMLRDGYWSDDKYTVGQEKFLYQDALDMSAVVCKPTATYNIDIYNLSVLPEYEGESFDLGNTVRIYDPELKINDYAIVSKTVEHPDKPTSDTATLKTDLLDIGTKTFSTVLERVTELAEQVRQNREIYQRAVSIAKDGTISSDMLNGAIDVLKTKLLSSSSSWTTDDKGNIIFTALDGQSAMMLCGSGYMIANSKKPNGAWDWRTFGTGEGFTADLIVAGFISAERIKANSITANHLASDVGESLDLSSNESVRLMVENAKFEIDEDEIVGIVRGSDEYQDDLGKLVLTPEKFETLIKSDENFTSLKQQADWIIATVQSEDGSTIFELTPESIKAITDNVEISAKNIKAIAEKIDLSANTTVNITSEHIKQIANQIDLSSNDSINLMVGNKGQIFRGENPPENGNLNDLWIQPSTGYTYQNIAESNILPHFYTDEDGSLYYMYDEDQVKYPLYMDEKGNLHMENGDLFSVDISEDGVPSVTIWQRVKDGDLSRVELNIKDDRIVGLVTNNQQFKDVVDAAQRANEGVANANTALQEVSSDLESVGGIANSTAESLEETKGFLKEAEHNLGTVSGIANTLVEALAKLEGKVDNNNKAQDDTVATLVGQLQDRINLCVVQDDLLTYLQVLAEGVRIGMSASLYNVLVTNTGINIRYDNDTVASFIKRQLTSPSVRIASPKDQSKTRCVMRVAADGGMMIVNEEATV